MSILHNAAAVLFGVAGILALVDVVKQRVSPLVVVGLLLAAVAGLVLALA